MNYIAIPSFTLQYTAQLLTMLRIRPEYYCVMLMLNDDFICTVGGESYALEKFRSYRETFTPVACICIVIN